MVVVADFGFSRVFEDDTLFNTVETVTQQSHQSTQQQKQQQATVQTTSCDGTSLIAAAKRKQNELCVVMFLRC
jgi:hypothetical protein